MKKVQSKSVLIFCYFLLQKSFAYAMESQRNKSPHQIVIKNTQPNKKIIQKSTRHTKLHTGEKPNLALEERIKKSILKNNITVPVCKNNIPPTEFLSLEPLPLENALQEHLATAHILSLKSCSKKTSKENIFSETPNLNINVWT